MTFWKVFYIDSLKNTLVCDTAEHCKWQLEVPRHSGWETPGFVIPSLFAPLLMQKYQFIFQLLIILHEPTIRYIFEGQSEKSCQAQKPVRIVRKRLMISEFNPFQAAIQLPQIMWKNCQLRSEALFGRKGTATPQQLRFLCTAACCPSHE